MKKFIYDLINRNNSDIVCDCLVNSICRMWINVVTSNIKSNCINIHNSNWKNKKMVWIGGFMEIRKDVLIKIIEDINYEYVKFVSITFTNGMSGSCEDEMKFILED